MQSKLVFCLNLIQKQTSKVCASSDAALTYRLVTTATREYVEIAFNSYTPSSADAFYTNSCCWFSINSHTRHVVVRGDAERAIVHYKRARNRSHVEATNLDTNVMHNRSIANESRISVTVLDNTRKRVQSIRSHSVL